MPAIHVWIVRGPERSYWTKWLSPPHGLRPDDMPNPAPTKCAGQVFFRARATVQHSSLRFSLSALLSARFSPRAGAGGFVLYAARAGRTRGRGAGGVRERQHRRPKSRGRLFGCRRAPRWTDGGPQLPRIGGRGVATPRSLLPDNCTESGRREARCAPHHTAKYMSGCCVLYDRVL